jgi:sugar lactone lactonase YvrE
MTITSATPGATIRYTLDGSVPTTNSPVYTAPFPIDGNTTLKARAFRSDLADSDVPAVYYALLYVTMPVFDPAQGPVTNGTSVTIACSPPDAVIYYTLDNTTPTTNSAVYSAPLVLAGNQTLKAFATKDGYGASGIRSTVYDLWIPEKTMVTTLAGSATPGWLDGTGYAARFNSPAGLCLDATGNVYVADTGNHVIRRIDTNGVVTTVAGSGSPGYQNGVGTNAQFNVPVGICVGANGDIFVADRQNRRIRRVTPAGVVSTFSGSGATGTDDGPPGIATFAFISHMTKDPAGNLYVGSAGAIRKIATNGVVTSIGLSQTSMAYDPSPAAEGSTNLWIVSSYIYVDQIVSGVGESTYAGSAPPGFADGPLLSAKFPQYPDNNRSIVRDLSGSLYVSDPARIRRLRPDGQVTTWAGSGVYGYQNGPGIIARFSNPAGVASDTMQTIYVADSSNHRVRKIWRDDDEDTVPDVLEGGATAYVIGADDRTIDSDHDGMSNAAEFWAGTNPLNAGSFFAVQSVSIMNDGYAVVRWQSVAGKTYSVKYSDDLTTWNVLAGQIAGDGLVLSIADPTLISPVGHRFYRVFLADY